MDKYEYKLKLDQMKSLTAEKDYQTAALIADTINWNKIKNINALVKAGEIYEHAGRFEESREILLLAYDRSPIGRMIIYRLARVAIKMKNYDEAKDYYQEFVEIAPHDNLKYVLKYEICKAEGADNNTLIGILEELKDQEYTEEWAYQLACLYHKEGMSDKCVDACDELVLWFGDGPYVERALELKMIYQPLTKVQEEKYRQFRQKKEGVVEVRPEDNLSSGEIVNETVQIPDVQLSVERFNTQNLQKELQKSMQQIMEATEREAVDDSMDNIKKLVGEIPYLQIPKGTLPKESSAEHMAANEEIDRSLKNNFQELLAEDYDGQMSLHVPGGGLNEKQITGQISIEDVLTEWEKTRRAAEVAMQEIEQQKLELVKTEALRELEDIMNSLEVVMSRLDSGLTLRDLLDEKYLKNSSLDKEETAQVVANMTQILQGEIDRISTENERMDERLAAAAAEREKQAPQEELEVPSDDEWLPKFEEMQAQARQPFEEALSEEPEEDAEEPEDVSVQEQPKEPEAVEEEGIEEPEAIGEEGIEGSEAIEEGIKEPEAIEKEEGLEEPFQEPETMDREEARGQEGGVERGNWALPEQTKEMPPIRLAKEEEEPDSQQDGPALVKSLDEELRLIFTYFIPIKGMEEQICQAINGAGGCLLSGRSASSGNLIIQGEAGSGKTVLATDMVKALQKVTGHPNGKIGKIEAAALNEKDIAALLKKVAGGCLIIEKAGEISKETATKLALLLESDTSGVFVIMEDTRSGIEEALRKDKGFASSFTEKIHIPIFTSDELVVFSESYANELGYTIDGMGTLALHKSISSIQKYDRPTTLAEVKDIIDAAIARSEKGGLKKAFSIITSRRYDKEDYIILREKDFAILE